MWTTLLGAALAAPLVLHIRLEEEGELPLSWAVSGLAADAPPVLWTTADGHQRRAIASVFPFPDPARPMFYARVVVMERRRGHWVFLTMPSLLHGVGEEPAEFMPGKGAFSWRFSAASDDASEAEPGLHIGVFAEQIVAGSVKVGAPGLEGVACPDDPDLRDLGEGMMASLVFSHVDDTPGASVAYACEKRAADGTTTPFPLTLRVW